MESCLNFDLGMWIDMCMLVAKMLIVFAKQTELFAHPVAMCELVLVAFAAVESFSLRQRLILVSSESRSALSVECTVFLWLAAWTLHNTPSRYCRKVLEIALSRQPRESRLTRIKSWVFQADRIGDGHHARLRALAHQVLGHSPLPRPLDLNLQPHRGQLRANSQHRILRHGSVLRWHETPGLRHHQGL
eukprot:2091883-Rhodomonas_salina.1